MTQAEMIKAAKAWMQAQRANYPDNANYYEALGFLISFILDLPIDETPPPAIAVMPDAA